MKNRILISLFALLIAIAIAVTYTSRVSAKTEAQPHMQAAREHLEAAQKELHEAVHDKGGHLAKAQEYTQRAIQEVDAGIQYANQHAK